MNETVGAARIYELARHEARATWGIKGWMLLSKAQRRAFVAERLLRIAAQQDERHVGDKRVRQLVTTTAQMLDADDSV